MASKSRFTRPASTSERVTIVRTSDRGGDSQGLANLSKGTWEVPAAETRGTWTAASVRWRFRANSCEGALIQRAIVICTAAQRVRELSAGDPYANDIFPFTNFVTEFFK